MTSSNPTDLRRIHLLTRHYELLQGVVVIPPLLMFGFVVLAGTPLGAPLNRPLWYLLAIVVGIGLGIGAWGVHRWFARQYGQVRPGRRQGYRLMAVIVGTTVGLWVLRLVLPDLPVSPEALVIAAVALVAASRLRPVALPLATVGILLATVGMLPIGRWVNLPAHPLSTIPYLVTTVCLAGAIVAGWNQLLLHRALRETN